MGQLIPQVSAFRGIVVEEKPSRDSLLPRWEEGAVNQGLHSRSASAFYVPRVADLRDGSRLTAVFHRRWYQMRRGVAPSCSDRSQRHGRLPDGREATASGLILLWGHQRARIRPESLENGCLAAECLSHELARIWNAATCSTYVNCSGKRGSRRQQPPSLAFRNAPPRFTPRLHYTISNKPEYCILRSRSNPSLQRLLKRLDALEHKNELHGMSRKIRIDSSTDGLGRGLLAL
ncbi:hypothetical protein X777_00638 [Ooceraea biroi]|uniref:Uncharacterized protein n=1 Tax=Ooceraea biroi TaxID=2015173 RepID=A0A026X1T8_OOCBI|nr:hypothetical protein X777_00638 [Ooceraea biroi]